MHKHFVIVALQTTFPCQISHLLLQCAATGEAINQKIDIRW